MKYLELLKATFSEWNEDKAPMLAAALAYYTIFALAPLLILVIAVAGFIWQGNVQGRLLGQLRGLVGNSGAEVIKTMIENAGSSGSSVFATIIGIAVLLIGATGVFVQLQNALNQIWDVAPKGGLKELLKVRLTGFGMVLGIGFLLLVSLLVSAAISALSAYFGNLLPGTDILWQLVEIAASLVIITFLFAMIFKFLPDVRIAWSDVWIGAAVTALLFTVGKFLIGLYLGRSSVASTYGAAGSLVVILLWIYYSAQILLFGAEFTQVYAKRHGSRIVPDGSATAKSP